jgi:archaellum component FlaG (FlaF/FlaG flagellin family)
MNVYIVVENGAPYPTAFGTYKTAAEAVFTRHANTIVQQMADDSQNADDILNDVTPVENPMGITYIYIEKGIHIYIYRLPYN